MGVFFQTSRLTLNVLNLWSPVRVLSVLLKVLRGTIKPGMYSLQQTDIKDEEGVIDGVVGVFFQTSRLTLNVLNLWSPVRVLSVVLSRVSSVDYLKVGGGRQPCRHFPRVIFLPIQTGNVLSLLDQ